MSVEIKGWVYTIAHIDSGKFYVGSTMDIVTREYTHFKDLEKRRHKCIHLQRAYNLYSREKFIFAIEEEFSSIDEAREREAEMLDSFWNSGVLYNMSRDAYGGDRISTHPDREEIRKRMSAAMLKMFRSLTPEERKAKYSDNKKGPLNGRWGTKASEETRRKMRRKASEETRQKMSKARIGKGLGSDNPFYGCHHTAKTKELIGARKVEINGIFYESLAVAARKLGVCRNTIKNRTNSSKYPEYRWIIYAKIEFIDG